MCGGERGEGGGGEKETAGGLDGQFFEELRETVAPSVTRVFMELYRRTRITGVKSPL